MFLCRNIERVKVFLGSFDISWEQRKLGEVFDCSIPNNTYSRSELNYEEGSVYDVHYGDVLVKYGAVLDVTVGDLPYITDMSKENFIGQLLRDGDIVFADTAEDETTGKACEIAGSQNFDVVSGLHTMVCRPKLKFAPFYLGYYINSDAYHRQLLPLMQGIKVLSLSKTNMQNTVVQYPADIKEQAQIGSFFKQLDSLITLHQREHEKICTQPMCDKFAQKSRKNISWEQRKLGEVGTTYTGLAGKTKDDFGHGSARFITYMNVFTNPIVAPDMVENVEIDITQNEVRAGDVFFTTSSETPEEVGMSSVLLENMPNTYLNSFCFAYRPMFDFDKFYLAYLLRSKSFREKITLLAQGISRYNISKTKVMEINIDLPKLSEQKKIGAFFKQLDDLITLHQRKPSFMLWRVIYVRRYKAYRLIL